jgi:hypothetical protein
VVAFVCDSVRKVQSAALRSLSLIDYKTLYTIIVIYALIALFIILGIIVTILPANAYKVITGLYIFYYMCLLIVQILMLVILRQLLKAQKLVD